MFELQQERKQAVVLVHAAVCDDDIQRPVDLGDVARKKRRKKCNCCKEERHVEL